MSRYCGEKNTTPILEAADLWRQNSLLHGQSIFGFGPIWNTQTTQELMTYFVENLDYGEGNFTEKLEKQIAPTSAEAKLLCAEILWVMLLAPSNIKPKTKRQNVETILSWANKPLPDDLDVLSDQALIGIGSGGTAYNNLRWKEMVYFILLLKEFFVLPNNHKEQLLSDGDKLAQWLELQADNEHRQLRHMLLYLLFPDSFERIFGTSDRIKIVKSFSNLDTKTVKHMSAFELDKELSRIRKQQEEIFQTDRLDWYIPPLRALWMNTTKSEDSTDQTIYPTLLTFIEQAHTEDLKTKDYPGRHAGLTMRVSFGAGNQAHVPWIGLLKDGQSPTKGIYPVYLYYRADRLLILAKGVSATNPPQINWNAEEGTQTVDEYFQTEFHKPAIRYGESYVHAVYDLSESLDKEFIDADLDSLIEEYLETLGQVPATSAKSQISEPTSPTYTSEPKPIDTPPSIWPSTAIGLRARPTS